MTTERPKLHAALDVILDALALGSANVEQNRLIPLSDVTDIEGDALRRLVRDGHLKTVRIGRKLFTSTQELAKLVDKLPAATLKNQHLAEEDDLLDAATKRAAKEGR